MENKKAVILDVDGTIWDSSDQVARSWSHTLTRLAGEKIVVPVPKMRSTMGLAMDDIAKIIIPEKVGAYSRSEALVLCMEEENDYLVSHPGVYYPGIAGAIASSRFAHFISGHACYGDNHLEKAENLAYLMKREGIAEAVYVGDTLHDEEETHKAGLPFIHASYGYGKAEHPEGIAPAPSAVYPVAKQILRW